MPSLDAKPDVVANSNPAIPFESATKPVDKSESTANESMNGSGSKSNPIPAEKSKDAAGALHNAVEGKSIEKSNGTRSAERKNNENTSGTGAVEGSSKEKASGTDAVENSQPPPDASSKPETAPATKNNAVSLRVVQLADDDKGEKNITRLRDVKLSQTLAQVRSSLKKRMSPKQEFCHKDGAAEDDDITLAEYLSAESEQEEIDEGGEAGEKDAEKVAPKSTSAVLYISAPPVNEKRETVIPEAPKIDLGERLERPEVEPKKFQPGDRAFEEDPEVEEGLTEGAKHASELTIAEWEEVLANAGAMCGWYIDRKSNRIVQAPKAAFQLRSLMPQQQSNGVSENERPPATSLEPDSSTAPGSSEVGSAKADAINVEKKSENSKKDEKPAKETPAKDKSTGDEPPEDGPKDEVPTKAKPRFHINDSSKIEIITASHEFEISMATSDFSSESTEGSISGGYGGFGASVSAGKASSKSSTNTSTVNTYQKTMIAKYLYPRATIYLVPDELEPTPELKAAIVKIEKSRSIVEMRKLHRDFGQLFCSQVTVGGRLLATKIMKSTTSSTEQTEKQEYKVSVAAAVTTPYGGASVKHDKASGSSTSTNQGQDVKNEQHAFEAVGGDTILASNPPKWATSCSAYRNWRVIDRVGLTPMADAISQLPGYSAVKAIFAQAVPTLSQYFEMRDTREVKVRLRLTNPLTQLSYSWMKRDDQFTYADPTYYLGHAPDFNICPYPFAIKDPQNAFWGELVSITGGVDIPLFNPRSYRAPAIYGYPSNKVGDSYFGGRYNQEYADTIWSITAPYDDVLKDGCRVVIRTVPMQPAVDTSKDSPLPAQPSSLSVFRNQQGVFLPAMSDEDSGQIFRLLKRGATTPGESIKEGDDIRICWNFKDQAVGYRDFTEDIFGRRRHAPPIDIQASTLLLKLPWPRFESLEKPADGKSVRPNALVMAPVPTEEPVRWDMCTLPAEHHQKRKGAKMLYGVQDVAFRIDFVENDGKGDVYDYMLCGLKQNLDDKSEATQRRPGQGLGESGKLLAAQFFLDTKF